MGFQDHRTPSLPACPLPRWKRPWRRRAWTCGDCGRSWTVRWAGSMDGGYYHWDCQYDPYREAAQVEVGEEVPDDLTHYMRSTGRLRKENEVLRDLVDLLYRLSFEVPLRGNRAYRLPSDHEDSHLNVEFEEPHVSLLKDLLG